MLFRIQLNYRGGRRSHHLKNTDLIQASAAADRVVVLVGNNDLGHVPEEKIIENYWNCLSTIGSDKFRIVGLMPRLDCQKAEIALFNSKLRTEFTWRYIPCKFVSQKNFAIADQAHLDITIYGAIKFIRLVHFIVNIYILIILFVAYLVFSIFGETFNLNPLRNMRGVTCTYKKNKNVR